MVPDYSTRLQYQNIESDFGTRLRKPTALQIELPKPDQKTKLKIFGIHTSGMHMDKDVSFEALLAKEKEASGADIKVPGPDSDIMVP